MVPNIFDISTVKNAISEPLTTVRTHSVIPATQYTPNTITLNFTIDKTAFTIFAKLSITLVINILSISMPAFTWAQKTV